MAVACRTCSHIEHNAADRAAGNMTWFTFCPATVSRWIKLDGDVSREECLLDFAGADTEGDGYIGFKEFIVWWTG
jgi:hypothetical protein